MTRAAPVALCLALVLGACAAAPSASDHSAHSLAASVEPSPSPTETAEPTASESGTPSVAPSAPGDGSFAIAPNPDADALFLQRRTCQNDLDGYRLAFPAAWFTNEDAASAPPCRWYASVAFDAGSGDEPPAEVSITIEFSEGDFGTFETEVSREEGIVGATQVAVRTELRGGEGEGGVMPAEWRGYFYVVQLGPTPEEGPNLRVSTTNEMAGDYELNKAILDRIMATIEFLGTTE